MNVRIAVLCSMAPALLAGCALFSGAPDATPGAPQPAVEPPMVRAPCSADFVKSTGELLLPPTVAPPAGQSRKGQPYRFANAIPVGGDAAAIGSWASTDGVARWRLRVVSEGAKSLSLHLKPFALPRDGELWLCSMGGSQKQGPFRLRGPAGDGELWTPALPGSELWVDVSIPAAGRDQVVLHVAEVFGAFR